MVSRVGGGWGSAPRRPAFGIIAAASRPPPGSPRQVGGRRPRIKSGAGSPPFRALSGGGIAPHVLPYAGPVRADYAPWDGRSHGSGPPCHAAAIAAAVLCA